MKNFVSNIKAILILITILTITIVAYKTYKDTRSIVPIESKEEKLGKIKILEQTYKEKNKELRKDIDIFREISKINDESVYYFYLIEENNTKESIKEKKRLTKKVEIIKKQFKKIPKNINIKKIEISPIIFRKSGEAVINSVWNVYYKVEGKK